MEIWKDIFGYEGYYQVSNGGNVRSVDRIDTRGYKRTGKLIKPNKNSDGYLILRLYKEGNKKMISIHRLVALNFIPLVDGKNIVNHIDNCVTNNSVDNLEWCTVIENIKHRDNQNRQHKPIGIKNPNYGKKGAAHPTFGMKFDKSYLAKLVLDTKTGVFYDSLKDAMAAKGLPKSTYSKIIGLRKNNTGLIYA